MIRHGTISVHRRRFLAGLAGLALWGCARSSAPGSPSASPHLDAATPLSSSGPATSIATQPLASRDVPPTPRSPTPTSGTTPTATVIPPLPALRYPRPAEVPRLYPVKQVPVADGSKALAFSPRGDLLAVGQGATIALYPLPDLGTAHTFDHGSAVLSLAFSPDGSLLAAGGESSKSALWRIADGALAQSLSRPEGIEPFTAARWTFSRAGGLVAAGLFEGGAAIWRVGDGQPVLGVTGQGWGRIGSVAFADDERGLLALDLNYSNGHFLGDTALRSLDIAAQRQMGAIRIQAGLDGVFSDDGTLLALMFFGKPQVWRIGAGGIVPVRAFPVISEEKVPLTPQFSGDKRRLAATAQQLGAYIWETDTGALLALLDHGGASAMKLAISSDGALVATLGDDLLLRLWRVA